jgi:hypothetical protein
MKELPGLLQRNEVDFIVADYKLDRSNLEVITLGEEKYFLIEGRRKSARDDIFLGNDAADLATETFFKTQGKKFLKKRRSYFDDCYRIIDGVAMGSGKAVMPEHLVNDNNQIKISNDF